MAWDYELTSEQIAQEWMRMTFSHDSRFLDPVGDIMAESREAGVNYRNPLGLTHLFAQGHHYGPAPWYAEADRLDWTAAYYHRASASGIGFDPRQAVPMRWSSTTSRCGTCSPIWTGCRKSL